MTSQPALVTATIVLVAGASAPVLGQGLVDNATVLALFAQASGVPAPTLAPSAEQGTRLVWQAGASIDLYRRTTSGGQTLTPYGTGDFRRIVVQSDLRRTAADGAVSWFQFALTHSDDASAIPVGRNSINTLSVGTAGTGYRVAFGDVPVNFSTLGANTPLRGLLAERIFGRTTLSAAGGLLAPSWEALAERERRTTFLRNVWATKAEHPLGAQGRFFVTLQGFSDTEDSLPAGLSPLAPSSGRSATLGGEWREGRGFVRAEAGVSRWREQGSDSQSDHALIIDGGWQGERVGVQAGHHDLGRYYANLSAAAAGGIRETYVNATWTVTQGVGLGGELRRSVNESATPPTPPPVPTIPPGPVPPATPFVGTTDAATLRARFDISSVPGLAFDLSAGESRGKNNAGGAAHRTRNQSAALGYQRADWNASLAYQNAEIASGVASANDGSSDTWTLTLGRNWSGPQGATPALWVLTTQMVASSQRHKLDSGERASTDSVSLSATARHERWGSFSASVGASDGAHSVAGDTDTRWFQLDAGRNIGKSGSARAYVRASRNFQGVANAAYRERVAGLALNVQF